VPKGKGLSGVDNAFDVDVKHVQEDSRQATTPEAEESESFKRVTISLSPSLLDKLDRAVKNQKAKGASVNRSSYIARAVMQRIEQES